MWLLLLWLFLLLLLLSPSRTVVVVVVAAAEVFLGGDSVASAVAVIAVVMLLQLLMLLLLLRVDDVDIFRSCQEKKRFFGKFVVVVDDQIFAKIGMILFSFFFFSSLYFTHKCCSTFLRFYCSCKNISMVIKQ